MRIAVFGYAHPFGVGQVYGAEREIWYLIQELKSMGHECVVFTVGGCDLPGFDYVTLPLPWETERDIHYEAMLKYEKERGIRFDVIQSYMASGFISLEMRNSRKYYLEPFFSFRRWGGPTIIAYSKLLRHINGSNSSVIHFGIPESTYDRFEKKDEGYLCWIGRMDQGKAPDIAIEVAKRAGHRLILMGPSYHYPYFVEKIWPHIDDDQIIWLRGVTDDIKKRVFLKAKAFLSTNWENYHEMFGIVNIEALACGCPVIGWGNVNEPSAINFEGGEIITHGEHGFINEYRDYSAREKERSIQKAIEYVRRVREIDREKCRELFLEKFTSRVMAEKHVELYGE